MAKDNYEGEYHSTLHKHLYTNPEYYELRAKLACLNYFGGLGDLKSRKVLEFGCGLGQNIYWLSERGASVKGYDISKFALDFCRKKGLDATDKLGKLGKFDIIFSRHVLEHLPNPLESLKEMGDKLEKEGTLILVLPREGHENASFEPDIHKHLYSWNFRTINNLLDEAGFRVVENKVLPFAMGYRKLMPLGRINLELYDSATKLIGRLRGAKELKIVAIKR
jgi:SAM-dependent methyltransferase